MTTKRLVGGYTFRAELARARIANKAVRKILQRIIDEKPSPLLMSQFISIAAVALGENLEAITEMERIIAEAQHSSNNKTEEQSPKNTVGQ